MDTAIRKSRRHQPTQWTRFTRRRAAVAARALPRARGFANWQLPEMDSALLVPGLALVVLTASMLMVLIHPLF